jgi:hypothetical protein
MSFLQFGRHDGGGGDSQEKSELLQFLRPFSRAMKHPQNFDHFATHTIRQKVRRARDRQLSCVGYAAGPAGGGIITEHSDRFADMLGH